MLAAALAVAGGSLGVGFHAAFLSQVGPHSQGKSSKGCVAQVWSWTSVEHFPLVFGPCSDCFREEHQAMQVRAVVEANVSKTWMRIPRFFPSRRQHCAGDPSKSCVDEGVALCEHFVDEQVAFGKCD
jgi:hypothetical protein